MKAKILLTEIISCLLLAISAALLFTGWISFSEDSDAASRVEEFLSDLSGGLEDFEDMDRDEAMEQLEMVLEEQGVNATPEKFFGILEKIYAMFEDKKLTPYEYTTLASIGADMENLLPEDELSEDAALGLRIIKVGTLILAVLFMAILVCNALTLVLHIFRRKSCGYFNTFLVLLLIAASAFTVIVLNAAFAADGVETQLSFSSPMELSPMPDLSFFCSLLSGIFWSVAKRRRASMKASDFIAMSTPAQVTQAQAPRGTTRFCNQCGASVSGDTRSCPTCGNQL
ncbi:MAG: zinc ribbon domain-containing protein [Acetatifactor sp.]